MKGVSNLDGCLIRNNYSTQMRAFGGPNVFKRNQVIVFDAVAFKLWLRFGNEVMKSQSKIPAECRGVTTMQTDGVSSVTLFCTKYFTWVFELTKPGQNLIFVVVTACLQRAIIRVVRTRCCKTGRRGGGRKGKWQLKNNNYVPIVCAKRVHFWRALPEVRLVDLSLRWKCTHGSLFSGICLFT